MEIKSIVAATAIALAATVGSAYAAETFDTMRGLPAEEATTMTAAMLSKVIASGPVTGDTFFEAVLNANELSKGTVLGSIPVEVIEGGLTTALDNVISSPSP